MSCPMCVSLSVFHAFGEIIDHGLVPRCSSQFAHSAVDEYGSRTLFLWQGVEQHVAVRCSGTCIRLLRVGCLGVPLVNQSDWLHSRE